MHRKNIILYLFLLLSVQLFGQPDSNIEHVNQVTANLFAYGQWNTLIKEADTAFNNKIDFYALRFRTGIAWFYKKNYANAIPNLEQAMNFNPADTISLEYLYFSYINLGRTQEANKLLQQNHFILTSNLRKLEQQPFIKNIELSGGYLSADNKSTNDTTDVDGSENIWGQQVLFGDIWYSGITLTHRLSKNINLTHAYQYLNVERWENYSVAGQTYSYKNDVHQNEYYISTDLLIGKKYHVKPAVKLLFVDFTATSPPATYSTLKPASSTSVSINHQVYFLGIYRNFSITNIGISGSWSNLNTTSHQVKEQIQGNLSISIFPKGNLNLYSISNIIYQNQSKKNSFFLDQKIGSKLTKKIWIEGTATIGKFDNLILDYGYNVYNVPNYIKYKFGLNLLATITNNLQFSLYYNYTYRDDYYYKYNTFTTYEKIQFNYQTNSITGGLKWTF
jgi:hypothetical protein